MRREVELRVGDKRIALNLFAKEVITNVVLGLIGSLKGVASEREISLRIGAVTESGDRAGASDREGTHG